MRIRISKGLKPKFIKHMAMLMSICYLLGPLQPQLTVLLHELSHGLEMPTSILSHEMTAYHYVEVHQEHDHNNPKTDHNHKLIDLVDTIFDASNENHQPDKAPVTKVDLKKHISSEVLGVRSQHVEKIPKVFNTFKSPLNLGYPQVPDVPPQLLFS